MLPLRDRGRLVRSHRASFPRLARGSVWPPTSCHLAPPPPTRPHPFPARPCPLLLALPPAATEEPFWIAPLGGAVRLSRGSSDCWRGSLCLGVLGSNSVALIQWKGDVVLTRIRKARSANRTRTQTRTSRAIPQPGTPSGEGVGGGAVGTSCLLRLPVRRGRELSSRGSEPQQGSSTEPALLLGLPGRIQPPARPHKGSSSQALSGLGLPPLQNGRNAALVLRSCKEVPSCTEAPLPVGLQLAQRQGAANSPPVDGGVCVKSRRGVAVGRRGGDCELSGRSLKPHGSKKKKRKELTCGPGRFLRQTGVQILQPKRLNSAVGSQISVAVFPQRGEQEKEPQSHPHLPPHCFGDFRVLRARNLTLLKGSRGLFSPLSQTPAGFQNRISHSRCIMLQAPPTHTHLRHRPL